MNKPIVIGLSGVTSGGKSTIAKLLANHYPGSKIMCQDHYFKLDNQEGMDFLPELGHYNWDIMSAIDMKRFENEFHDNIKSISGQNRTTLLVAEGFLLLNYRPIADLLDLKYYFVLDYDECWTRRQTRDYDPPDVPGYFQQIVWPMHLKHKTEIFDMYKDVHVIDGKLPLDLSLNVILEDIGQINSVL